MCTLSVVLLLGKLDLARIIGVGGGRVGRAVEMRRLEQLALGFLLLTVGLALVNYRLFILRGRFSGHGGGGSGFIGHYGILKVLKVEETHVGRLLIESLKNFYFYFFIFFLLIFWDVSKNQHGGGYGFPNMIKTF